MMGGWWRKWWSMIKIWGSLCSRQTHMANLSYCTPGCKVNPQLVGDSIFYLIITATELRHVFDVWKSRIMTTIILLTFPEKEVSPRSGDIFQMENITMYFIPKSRRVISVCLPRVNVYIGSYLNLFAQYTNCKRSSPRFAGILIATITIGSFTKALILKLDGWYLDLQE